MEDSQRARIRQFAIVSSHIRVNDSEAIYIPNQNV